MTEIQQNRYDKLIRRVNNIVAAGSMVGDALNELFPTIDVENVPGELLALMGTRIAWARSDLIAGGGVFPQVQLFNPANSGTIITLTSLILAVTANNTVQYGTSDTPMTSLLLPGQFRDSRFGVAAAGRAVGQVRFQTTAVPVGGSQALFMAPQESRLINDDNGLCVLSPGFGLDVQANVAATRLLCSFAWRERVLEASEINLGG